MSRNPKRPRTEKLKRQLPKILRTPITYELKEGIAAHFNEENGRNFAAKLMEEILRRLEAIYEHYGIDKNDEDGTAKLLLTLAPELFPGGFRIIRSDQKNRGRKKERSIADQADLWVVMQALLDSGRTQDSAARFIKEHLPEIVAGISVPSIKTRFAEARRTMERIRRGEGTESEALALYARQTGIRLQD